MRLSASEFSQSASKRISLLGMSGVGKSTLAKKLPSASWFHYSGDYRIGTRYLDEEIHDTLLIEAMRQPMLKELLRTDSIYIRSNLTIGNLAPLSAYLGKLGNPERLGLELAEFKRRQKRHHEAEIRTFHDVPDFIERAQRLYGYSHFLNDAGGSLCELADPTVMETLAQHTVILYLQASSEDEELLIERAQSHPKPLYYRAEFLDQQLDIYMAENKHRYVAEIDPDDFVTWVFPALFRSRVPKYETLAEKYGYTIDARKVFAVRDEQDFLDLVAESIDQYKPSS